MAEARGRHFFLVVGFAVLIFGVGLSQAGIELARGDTPQFLDLQRVYEGAAVADPTLYLGQGRCPARRVLCGAGDDVRPGLQSVPVLPVLRMGPV